MNKLYKVAFITDASSPSGQAVARRLAADGYALALHDASSAPRSANQSAAIDASRVTAMRTSGPLTSLEAVQKVTDQVVQALGPIDVLVHNPEQVVRVPVELCTEEQFQSAVDDHVKSAFFCTQHIGAQMAAREQGQILYVSSIHDEKPTGSAFLYSIAKGAIKMLCREAALSLGRHGVRVNVIEMGPIAGDDERFASDISDLYVNYETKVPSAQLGTVDDLAHLIGFLVSDEARYLNGADVRLDGGFLLHYMDHKMKKLDGDRERSGHH
ncbi:MAG: SDR family NAD(P)-dependent oxidoreductase [Firmicutes bacterium]|nr:SDR family NAD(P)-dependent oxidoreductase [Bacillota bacterium]